MTGSYILAAGGPPQAKTSEVVSALADPTWVVVDARLNDAFNGWQLDGISRGGHIRGAVDFSANWLRVDDKDLTKTLKETLSTKGITADKHVIVYDANGKDALAVADYLQANGFTSLYLYDLKQWADDATLPMEKYKNYQRIVPAIIVKEILDGKKPESFEQAGQIKIVEASWGEEKTSYLKGHIPGTFHINTDRIEPPTTTDPVMWMLADDKTLSDFALEFGFTRDDTVIVTAEEPLASYRIAAVLRYIGVKDVRVLNGGTLAWTLAGYKLETERHDPPAAVTDFGTTIPGAADVIDTMAETKDGLNHPDTFTLVDNRTWQEHIGESTGYSYHKVKGRIPGSIYGYAGIKDAYSMDYFRNPDKTMRNASEFLALWEKEGIDTTKHLSFMCGSGWRAAEVYFFADTYGLEDIAIYSDGWIGWSNDSTNPIVTGDPHK
ncbi:thiosulfate sulfurtransferase [Desulforhopalus sp. IMCC35007]|nr:thiosulfate sulfurtransferase [Desulforhopalus sp. IMCC35007]